MLAGSRTSGIIASLVFSVINCQYNILVHLVVVSYTFLRKPIISSLRAVTLENETFDKARKYLNKLSHPKTLEQKFYH